ISNIQEIRARGARTLVIAEEGDEDVVPFADEIFRIPLTPLLMAPLVAVVPLQIFASALAAAKGYDVDQPRNLATAVTVERAARRSEHEEAGVVVRVGSDVVDVGRFMATLDRVPRLRGRPFAPAERHPPAASLAARSAAKEAIAQAMGAAA